MDNAEREGLSRTPAQFFFEVGFGAAYAQGLIQNNMKPPFAYSDALVEHAWDIAGEAHDDPAEFDAMLALANAARPDHPGDGGQGGGETVADGFAWPIADMGKMATALRKAGNTNAAVCLTQAGKEIIRLRAKQAAKPKHSPLPQEPTLPDPIGGVGEREAIARAVKDALRGEPGDDYTDAGMEDAFFRWPAIECAVLAALANPLAAPEGFVLVPREPTEAMLHAGHYQAVHGNGARAVYAAMLSASPALANGERVG